MMSFFNMIRRNQALRSPAHFKNNYTSNDFYASSYSEFKNKFNISCRKDVTALKLRIILTKVFSTFYLYKEVVEYHGKA